MHFVSHLLSVSLRLTRCRGEFIVLELDVLLETEKLAIGAL